MPAEATDGKKERKKEKEKVRGRRRRGRHERERKKKQSELHGDRKQNTCLYNATLRELNW